MTDEQLDERFRAAARQYNPPSAPEGAWEVLRENIEKAEQTGNKIADAFEAEEIGPESARLRRPRTWLISAAAVLLFFLGGVTTWYILNRDNKAGSVISTGENKVADSGDFGVSDALKHTKAADDSVDSGENRMMGENNYSVRTEAAPPRLKPPVLLQIVKLNRDYQAASPQIIDKAVAIRIITPFLRSETAPPVIKLNQAEAGRNMMPGRLSKSDFLAANDRFLSEDMNQHKTGPVTVNKDIEDAGRNTAPRKRGEWQLGLTVGPNLTTVNGTVGKTAGVNTGLVVQHRISDSKFSVGSGVVLESMTYGMAPEEFHPGGKTLNIPSLTSVEGKCQMLDVPVNVRYDVVRTSKSNAFVSTGVSGLLMAKESYSYNYNNQGQTYQKSVDVSGKGKSLYTVTNLSIGYERTFNRTSVQIEPYIKLPMSSIGYGQLNLGSLGTQVSIKQSF